MSLSYYLLDVTVLTYINKRFFKALYTFKVDNFSLKNYEKQTDIKFSYSVFLIIAR